MVKSVDFYNEKDFFCWITLKKRVIMFGNIIEKIRGWFRPELSLNRVRDTVTIREGDERIVLKVDSDARSIINRLNRAQKMLSAMDENTTDDERIQAAHDLSEAMFGVEQTKDLFAFYNYDAACVVAICGKYFGDPEHGLGKKITKVQKKRK